MARGKKLIIWLVAASPCLCCLGGIGYIQLQLNSVGAGLEGELAKTKAMGMATDVPDLKRAIPANQNAAREYLAAMAMVPDGSPDKKLLDQVQKALATSATPAESKAADEALGQLGSLVTLVERGSDKPHCDFHKDWNQGFNVLFPEYASVKGFEKLLAFKARRQGASHDWKGALQTIGRMQRLARHAGEEPILIAMLVQIACESITHATFRQVIAGNRSNPEFLREARKVAKSFGPLPDFRYALRGEVVMGRTAVYQIKNLSDLTGLSGSPTDDSAATKYVFMSSSVRKALDRKLVEAYNNLFERMPKDVSDWKGMQKASREHEIWISSDHSLLNTLNQILFPVFSQAATAVGRTQAQRNLTLTSIDLFEARARQGKLPSQLPKAEYSLDPFTGDPLEYKPSGNGFILYSVDQDGRDDGGITKPSSEKRDMVADMR